MKRVFIIFVLFLSLFITNVFAKEYKYVLDDGGLLKEDTLDYINTYSEYLDKTANIEYYVITVNSLGEYDLDTYTDIVYSNYIENKKDRGLLILVSKNDRQVKVISGKVMVPS